MGRRRDTSLGWTLQTHPLARILSFDDLDFPAGDRMPAFPAHPAIVERMPKMEFVEPAQNFELLFRRQLHGGRGAHTERIRKLQRSRNRSELCSAHRGNSDLSPEKIISVSPRARRHFVRRAAAERRAGKFAG